MTPQASHTQDKRAALELKTRCLDCITLLACETDPLQTELICYQSRKTVKNIFFHIYIYISRKCPTLSNVYHDQKHVCPEPAANHISLFSLWVWSFSRSLISVLQNLWIYVVWSCAKITALKRNFALFTFHFAPNCGILPA